MDITYLGHSSFKIKGKTTSVITDPFHGDKVGLKFGKSEADIITISHGHDDHNNTDDVTNVKKIITGPGEYEIAGVSIIGIQTFHDTKKGTERGKNTIYIIEIDGIRLLHLGDLGHPLEESHIKQLGSIDILFIPVGGVYTIDAKTAFDVVKQIGASIIIPMHYDVPGLALSEKLAPVNAFLTESSLRVEKMPKLSVKEGSVMSEEEYIVILEKR